MIGRIYVQGPKRRGESTFGYLTETSHLGVPAFVDLSTLRVIDLTRHWGALRLLHPRRQRRLVGPYAERGVRFLPRGGLLPLAERRSVATSLSPAEHGALQELAEEDGLSPRTYHRQVLLQELWQRRPELLGLALPASETAMD